MHPMRTSSAVTSEEYSCIRPCRPARPSPHHVGGLHDGQLATVRVGAIAGKSESWP